MDQTKGSHDSGSDSINTGSYPTISVPPKVDQHIAQSKDQSSIISEPIKRNSLLDELSNLSLKDPINPENQTVKNLAIGPKVQAKIPAKDPEKPSPPNYYERPGQQPYQERPAQQLYHGQQSYQERPAQQPYHKGFGQNTQQNPNPRRES